MDLTLAGQFIALMLFSLLLTGLLGLTSVGLLMTVWSGAMWLTGKPDHARWLRLGAGLGFGGCLATVILVILGLWVSLWLSGVLDIIAPMMN